ncbi:MAG: formate dehydrogenase accessory sulfurtransferase FdhD [Armatimonas sp.]
MTAQVPLTRWRMGETSDDTDTVAVEEPLEIRIGGEQVAITMRTPSDDEALACGFLFSEDVLGDRNDLYGIDQPAPNVIDITLAPGAQLDWEKLRRNVYISSSCGVCGKASAEAVYQACPTLGEATQTNPQVICALPTKLREAQSAFDSTGGVHAAARFTATGELIALREDVGRHNALDKLIGAAWLAGQVPLTGEVVFLSGRASFELVQKAAMAGVEILAAVGAPSSLAIETAERVGLTLIGFVKAERFNVYTMPGRILV